MISPAKISDNITPTHLESAATTGFQQDDGFAAILGQFLAQGVDTIRQGELAAADGIAGKVPLQTVVDKVTSAEQALQAGIALRDKIVAAYLEVSRMTI